jgi:hypothetical protein
VLDVPRTEKSAHLGMGIATDTSKAMCKLAASSDIPRDCVDIVSQLHATVHHPSFLYLTNSRCTDWSAPFVLIPFCSIL